MVTSHPRSAETCLGPGHAPVSFLLSLFDKFCPGHIGWSCGILMDFVECWIFLNLWVIRTSDRELGTWWLALSITPEFRLRWSKSLQFDAAIAWALVCRHPHCTLATGGPRNHQTLSELHTKTWAFLCGWKLWPMVLGYPKPLRQHLTKVFPNPDFEENRGRCFLLQVMPSWRHGWPWLGLSCLGKDIFSHLVRDEKGTFKPRSLILEGEMVKGNATGWCRIRVQRDIKWYKLFLAAFVTKASVSKRFTKFTKPNLPLLARNSGAVKVSLQDHGRTPICPRRFNHMLIHQDMYVSPENGEYGIRIPWIYLTYSKIAILDHLSGSYRESYDKLTYLDKHII